MFKKGDKISVLDEAINGTVLSINNNLISIETSEGFLMTYASKELIKIDTTNDLVNSIENVNIQTVTKEIDTFKKNKPIKEKKKNEIGVPEFDLHIEKLVPNKRGMSNYDILTLQADTAKRHLDFAIRNRIPKIIFIHGVGEGVLKAELDFLLGRYDNISFQEANYQKYGFGATEIFIKQN